MKVNSRRIAKLVKAPNWAEIILHFDDRSEKTEGFLAHNPKTMLRGSLAAQLGAEITPMSIIKVSPPFD